MVQFDYYKWNYNSSIGVSAGASEPKKRSDKEAGQVPVHRKTWSGMDLSHGARSSGNMQFHVAYMQIK